MHYVAPQGRGHGGFVVLPITRKPEPVREPRTAGWLAAVLLSAKASK